MAGVTVKRLDEFDNNGGFFRARAGLGVTSFGLAVEHWPPNDDRYPEHDESSTGQEEVYVVLEGSGALRAAGEEHRLEPGVFARVAPGVTRKLLPGADGLEVLCIGGVPGGVFQPRGWTEEGAPWG